MRASPNAFAGEFHRKIDNIRERVEYDATRAVHHRILDPLWSSGI
jgi:hypothetical protein